MPICPTNSAANTPVAVRNAVSGRRRAMLNQSAVTINDTAAPPVMPTSASNDRSCRAAVSTIATSMVCRTTRSVAAAANATTKTCRRRGSTCACSVAERLCQSTFCANQIANANAGRRRLLEDKSEFNGMSEETRRKLLQSSPASINWAATGQTTPVKDQGQCGSCYAHSSSSQMEAALAIATGAQPKTLSREQLKDCSSGSPGCNGGDPGQMFQYSQQGLTLEANYPYVANNANCQAPSSSAYSDQGYTAITPTEQAFTIALAKGPIAVTVCADTWDNYKGGIFENCTDPCTVDHAVLLVGYGHDDTINQDYWLIQNSWNTWWGEAGFIRLPNRHSNSGNSMCGLTAWQGYQAKLPVGPSGTTTTQDCTGFWSAWSACSVTCGGGSQTQTWTTTQQPGPGGAACPSSPQTQSCGQNLCPAPGGGGTNTVTGNCVHVGNSYLSDVTDGDYTLTGTWDECWCGNDPLPVYSSLGSDGNTYYMWFFAENCMNGQRTAGVWGLGTQPGNSAYEWSSQMNYPSNGVVPDPSNAQWSITMTAC